MEMLKSFNFELSGGQNLRELSVFRPPSYNITHGPDKALQWDPPADSDELAIALSYHFPVEKTLKRKMQAAVEKFLRQERPKRLNCVKHIEGSTAQKPGALRPISEGIPGLLSFNANTLEEVKMKRKRRAYEKAERAKVGSNRGNACEVHRRQKLKCDPAKCKRNGQFQQNHRGQVDLASSKPILSSSRNYPAEQSPFPQIDLSSPHQQEATQRSSSQGRKPVNEPINVLFASHTSYSATSNAPGPGNSNRRLTLDDTEGASCARNESQFMGFEPESSTFDDNFSFSLDPPFFLGQASYTENRNSWKPDEFLLSVLSHSMYA